MTRSTALLIALVALVLTPGAQAAKPRWSGCRAVTSSQLVIKTGPVHQIGSSCRYAREEIEQFLSFNDGFRGLHYQYNGRNEDPGVIAACVGRTRHRGGRTFIHVFCRGAGETGPDSGGAWRFDIDSRYYEPYE
ncbi:MAG: hypothetical protein ACJ762_07795 [Solirubrobacteraceae bacterium]